MEWDGMGLEVVGEKREERRMGGWMFVKGLGGQTSMDGGVIDKAGRLVGIRLVDPGCFQDKPAWRIGGRRLLYDVACLDIETRLSSKF